MHPHRGEGRVPRHALLGELRVETEPPACSRCYHAAIHTFSNPTISRTECSSIRSKVVWQLKIYRKTHVPSANLIAVRPISDSVLFIPVDDKPSGCAWSTKQLIHVFQGDAIHAHEFVAPSLTNEGFVSTLVVLSKPAKSSASHNITMIRVTLSSLTVLSTSVFVCVRYRMCYQLFSRITTAASLSKDSAYLVPLISAPDAFIFINVSCSDGPALFSYSQARSMVRYACPTPGTSTSIVQTSTTNTDVCRSFFV